MGKKKEKKLKKHVKHLKAQLMFERVLNDRMISSHDEKSELYGMPIVTAVQCTKDSDLIKEKTPYIEVGKIVNKLSEKISETASDLKESDSLLAIPDLSSYTVSFLFKDILSEYGLSKEDAKDDLDDDDEEDFIDYIRRNDEWKHLSITFDKVAPDKITQYTDFVCRNDLLYGFYIEEPNSPIKVKYLPSDNEYPVSYIVIGGRLFLRSKNGSGYTYFDLESGLPYKKFYESISTIIPDENRRMEFLSNVNECNCKIVRQSSIAQINDFSID